MFAKIFLALLALSVGSISRAEPNLSARTDLDGLPAYPDHKNPSRFYYVPSPLDLSKSENRYGLGLFTTGGVQFLLNNRISLAFEIEMNFVSNLNGNNEYGSNNNNRHFSNSIKLGFVFNKKPKTP